LKCPGYFAHEVCYMRWQQVVGEVHKRTVADLSLHLVGKYILAEVETAQAVGPLRKELHKPTSSLEHRNCIELCCDRVVNRVVIVVPGSLMAWCLFKFFFL